MALAADSVPGLSGCTIKFILEFYDDFVNTSNNLISNNKNGRIRSFRFLSKIGIEQIEGFIISSIQLIVKSEIKTLINNKVKNYF